MSEKPKRKTPRPAPKSFYLGAGEEADKRMKHLEEIAAAHDLTRSTLLQAIADGKLVVCAPESC